MFACAPLVRGADVAVGTGRVRERGADARGAAGACPDRAPRAERGPRLGEPTARSIGDVRRDRVRGCSEPDPRRRAHRDDRLPGADDDPGRSRASRRSRRGGSVGAGPRAGAPDGHGDRREPGRAAPGSGRGRRPAVVRRTRRPPAADRHGSGPRVRARGCGGARGRRARRRGAVPRSDGARIRRRRSGRGARRARRRSRSSRSAGCRRSWCRIRTRPRTIRTRTRARWCASAPRCWCPTPSSRRTSSRRRCSTLVDDPERLASMGARASEWAKPDAADRFASLVAEAVRT